MKYYIIDLKGTVVESNNIFEKTPFIEKDNTFALDRFYILKEKLKARKKTKRIMIVMHHDFRAYPGQYEEIYRYLKELKEAGKELYFYAKTYELRELYLASICQHRLIPEMGTIVHYGLSSEKIFLKNFLDLFSIRAEVYRRGKYKGAADTFRLNTIDEAQREAISLLVKRFLEIMEDTVRENIQSSVDYIQELKNGSFFNASQAMDTGLITGENHWFNVIKSWEETKLKKDKVFIKKLVTGKGPKIAVLSFDGHVVDGDNKKNSLMGNACGDHFYLREIRKLTRDKAIKGVVFKVNSGGGSASASAEIASALAALREQKPLVVVQSGVAASGGYFISFPGERIFTQHSTITGSIGVIFLLFYVNNYLEKRGITHSSLKNGEYSDLLSVFRDRDELDQEMIMEHIDHIYDNFIMQTAAHRNMKIDEVDKVAQGRIWSGVDAIEKKICDVIGGLDDALAYLKEKEGIAAAKYEFYPKPRKGMIRQLLGSDKSEGMDVLSIFNISQYVDCFSRKSLCFTEELFMFDFRF